MSDLTKYSDLFKRIKFTILMLLVYRLGSFIPIAGVDAHALEELTKQNQSGILGMFNVLSGGSLGRMSIFALAIMPYITSSIIIQLMSIAYKPLDNLKKEGEAGRRKINQLSRYLTIALASIQAYGVASWLEGISTGSGSVVVISGLLFKASAVITLVVGTIFLMWLGEQITARGIGSGASLIIFTGIVSGLPSGIISVFELMRKGSLNVGVGLLLLGLSLGLVAVVVFFERSMRKVAIHYPKHRAANANLGQDTSYIPLKLNTSGVIAPMFSSSILLFPLTIVNFAQDKSDIAEWLSYHLGHGKPLFILLYSVLIVFFSFFYTAVVFNVEDVSNNLKKSNAFIPGIRPGAGTAEHFDYILSRITVIGALYLCLVCALPEFLIGRFAFSFAMTGTSVLIVVNVVMETMSQIHAYTLNNKYATVMKKFKIGGGGR